MGLISEFGFSEGSGLVAADSSGNGYALTASNGTTSWTAGKNGGGATQTFTGLLGPNVAFSSWTVMFWLKVAALPGTTTGLVYQDTGPVGEQFYLTLDSTGTLLNWTNTAPVYSSTTIPVGTWVHVAVSWGVSGNTTIYFNGAVDATGANGVGMNFGAGQDWYIAPGVSRYPDAFNGVIDDLRVFDEELSQSDIQTWMSTSVEVYTTNRCVYGYANGGNGAGVEDSPSGEKPEKAFDGVVWGTKWLQFKDAGAPSFFIQYNFGVGYARKIAKYSLTTAGDATERDPKTWTLLASNTGAFTGEEVLIDTVGDGGLSDDRWITTTFICDVPATQAYQYYRFVISDLKNLASANSCQLAEIEMMELRSNNTGPLPTSQTFERVGAVLQYGFDEGGGTTFAEASGGPSGVMSAEGSFVAGRNGTAIVASGDDVAGSIAGSPVVAAGSWKAISIMMWVRRASEGNAFAVFSGGDSAGLKFAAGGSQVACWLRTNSSFYEFSPFTHGVANGDWMHIAWTWSAFDETLRLFIDGSEIASNSLSGATFAGDISSIDIGGVTIWNGANPLCAIDDFRVFNEALSQSDIQVWMNTPVLQYTTDRCEGGVASAGGGAGTTYSPGGNEPNRAFDNITTSNWLRVRSGGNIPPVWLQYDFGIGYERKIARYSITTSSSDSEAHDPKTWMLLASNTGAFSGEEVMVDSQADGQLPSTRGGKKTFDCSNSPSSAYRFYRLVISEQKNTGIVSATTIAEMEMMELLADSTGPLPVPSAGGNTVLPAPISSYNFSEQTGITTADRTGNGYTLTTSGSGWVPVDADYRVGGKEDFKGQLGPNILQQEWTVMAWVKWNAMAVPYMAIVSNSSNFYLELWRNGTSIECYSGVAGHPSSGPNVVPSGTWAHIAATRQSDGTSIVFVNGEAIVTGNGNAANFGAGTWYVGGANSPSYTLDGAVNNLYVFDSALTATEIRAWMNVYPGHPPMTLLAAYAFNEADGSSTVKDYSGNNITATASGVAFGQGPHANTRAVSFTSSGQYVHIPQAATEPDSVGVTVMCWAKGPVDMDYIVKPRGNNSTRMGIGPSWRARWKDDLHYLDGGGGIDTNQWHHYCVSEADDRWLVFIDGQYYDGGSRSVNPNTPAPWENYPWCIGDTLGSGLGDSRNGQTVAEVRIFKGYITEQRQIDYWMNTPVCPVSRKFEIGGLRRPIKLGNAEKHLRS